MFLDYLGILLNSIQKNKNVINGKNKIQLVDLRGIHLKV